MYLDDGSALTADSGNKGLKVVDEDNNPWGVVQGDFVSFVGVSSADVDPSTGDAYKEVKMPGISNVTVYIKAPTSD